MSLTPCSTTLYLGDFGQVNQSKGDQSRVFSGRTDAKAETPILWSPHAKSWLIGKDSDTGRYWGQEEKGTTEDEMAGWHHRLDGCEFGWTPGVGDGREAWRAAVHGVAKSRTRLSDWTELNQSSPQFPHLSSRKNTFFIGLIRLNINLCKFLKIVFNT